MNNLSEALETMNWTTPRSPAELKEWAGNFLNCATKSCPLRKKVAAAYILKNA